MVAQQNTLKTVGTECMFFQNSIRKAEYIPLTLILIISNNTQLPLQIIGLHNGNGLMNTGAQIIY